MLPRPPVAGEGGKGFSGQKGHGQGAQRSPRATPTAGRILREMLPVMVSKRMRKADPVCWLMERAGEARLPTGGEPHGHGWLAGTLTSGVPGTKLRDSAPFR